MTCMLVDCNDYDRAELDLRDIEIELSSLLNTIALNLNGSEDETSFGNGSDTALQLLSTYCSELKMNLASYGVKEVVKNDEEEDGDELTISLHGDSPTEPSALTGGNIDDQSKMVAPFMRQLQATGGLTPSQQRVAQGGGMKRRRTLKQGFGGGFARAPKSTLEELSVLIKRSKQNQMKNGWKLFFPLFTWLLSAIIIGLVAPNIGEEDAVGTIYTPDASSGESLDVEYFSVSSATFVVSITPLLLLAFNVPYLHLQHVRLKEETSIGLVNQVSVWLSVYIGDLPMYILFTILYAGITYGMVGFQGSLGSFVTLLISVTLCFYSLSVCCAALAENVVVAGLYYIRVCALCMLFAGYYETIPNLSTFWTFFTYISPSRWAFESSMLLMYADAENAGEYLDLYAFDDGKVGIGITWLCVWFGSLSILSLMLMSPITAKVSRKLKKQPENCKNFKTPQKLQPSWNRLQTGTYSHIESNINPLTSDETLSPQSPSPLLEGESEEKSILSFPEICDGGRVSTDISKSFAGSVRYSDRLDKCSGRIPIAATTGISADAQMTLSFRQVTYTNRETEDSSQGEDSGLLFANSVPFIFNSYSNSEKKATREPSHPVIDSRQVMCNNGSIKIVSLIFIINAARYYWRVLQVRPNPVKSLPLSTEVVKDPNVYC